MKKDDCTLPEAFGDAATNYLDTANALRERKAFATLAARFALLGHALIKGDPAIEGQAPYFVAGWGMGVHPLTSLDAAMAFLVQMSGAGDGAR